MKNHPMASPQVYGSYRGEAMTYGRSRDHAAPIGLIQTLHYHNVLSYSGICRFNIGQDFSSVTFKNCRAIRCDRISVLTKPLEIMLMIKINSISQWPSGLARWILLFEYCVNYYTYGIYTKGFAIPFQVYGKFSV